MLIISERRLGDICIEIPVLQSLRGAYPNAELVVVAPAALQSFIAWATQADTLFDFTDRDEISSRSWDAAIDLTTDYHIAPARLAAASRAPVRVGFENAGRGQFFNVMLPVLNRDHVSQTYRSVLRPLQAPFKPSPLPALEPAPDLPSRFVAIHPGAHHHTQRWPADYFEALVRRLHDAGDFAVVLGSESERELIESIIHKSGTGAIARITSDVFALAAAIRSAQILICNNSGPLHLAGLLGTPTLSFMGPTLKSRWWPQGRHDVVLRRDKLPCIGCNLGYCKIQTHACMRDIDPERVFATYLDMKAEVVRDSSA